MKARRLFCLLSGIIPFTNPAFAAPDQNKDFPIELVCPATKSNGTLDLVSGRLSGVRNRIRVVYANFNPESVEAAVATPEERDLRPVITIVLGARNNPVDQEWGNELAAKANALKTGVCEGSASNRQRYLAALARNKEILRNRNRSD